MAEIPRPENFQQATEITDEIPTQVTVAGSQAKAPAPKRNLFRRAALVLALLAGPASGAHYGHDYWINARYLESTDEPHLKAAPPIISPKVLSYIWDGLVGENEQW